jgi:hypothetical protein
MRDFVFDDLTKLGIKLGVLGFGGRIVVSARDCIKDYGELRSMK